jgi:hypothetical protein
VHAEAADADVQRNHSDRVEKTRECEVDVLAAAVGSCDAVVGSDGIGDDEHEINDAPAAVQAHEISPVSRAVGRSLIAMCVRVGQCRRALLLPAAGCRQSALCMRIDRKHCMRPQLSAT